MNTSTSFLLLISSTRSSGFPLGIGIVPSTTVPEPASIWRTAWIKAWLKSSILPISSMTQIFFAASLPWFTCGKVHQEIVNITEHRTSIRNNCHANKNYLQNKSLVILQKTEKSKLLLLVTDQLQICHLYFSKSWWKDNNTCMAKIPATMRGNIQNTIFPSEQNSPAIWQ